MSSNFILYAFAALISLPFVTPALVNSQEDPAQEIPQAQEISSFEQALEMTYNFNPQIKEANILVEKAHSQVQQEFRKGWLPSADLSATQSLQNRKVERDHPLDGTSRTRRLGVELRQNLYKGGQTMAATQKAEEGTRQAFAEASAKQQEVFSRVVQSIADIVYYQRLIGYRKENVALLKRTYDRAQARYDVGEIYKAELESTRADYDGAIAELQQDLGELEVAKGTFEQLVGAPVRSNFTLGPRVEKKIHEISDYRALEPKALALHPSILSAVHAHKGELFGRDVTASEFGPAIDARLQKERGIHGLSGERGLDKSWSALVSLSVPLYSPGASTSMRIANQSITQGRLKIREARLNVVQDLRKSWQQWRIAQRSAAALKAQCDAAALAVAAAREQWNVGAIELIDLLDIIRKHINALVRYEQNRRSLMLAYYGIQASLGKMDAASLKQEYNLAINVPRLEDMVPQAEAQDFLPAPALWLQNATQKISGGSQEAEE